MLYLKVTRLHMGRSSDKEPMFHKLEELDLQSVHLESMRFLPETLRVLRLDDNDILPEIFEAWEALDRPNIRAVTTRIQV